MTKFKCKRCGNNHGVLTKEKLCAYCYKKEHKEWPSEFSNSPRDEHKKMKSKGAAFVKPKENE